MNVSGLWLKESRLAVIAAAVAGALAAGAQQAQDRPRENANPQQQTQPRQQAQPQAQPRPQAEQQTQIARSDTGMQTLEQHLQSKPLRVSKLVGMELQSRNGDNLGETHDVLRGTAPGQEMHLVVKIGGVGAEEKMISVPFDEVQINADGDELYTSRTREQLAAMPALMLDARIGSGTTSRTGAEPARTTQPAAPGAAAGGAGQRGTVATSAAASTSVHERRIGDLVGAEVVGNAGDKVGEVDDIVISTAGADSIRAVLQVGGVAGIGEKRVALPLRQVTVERAADGEPKVRVAMDVESLERLPEFEYEEDTAAL